MMFYRIIILLLVVVGQANASAFQIFVQSANSVGYAHADMAALADDASTAYYNPAGMTRLKRPEISVGATNVTLVQEFRSRVTSPPLSTPVGVPILNVSLSTIDSYLPRTQGYWDDTAPNFHGVLPLTGAPFEATLGFSVVPTFALETDLFASIMTGYAEDTRVKCIAFNPSFAIKPFCGLSLGGGFSIQKCSNLYTSSILIFGIEAKLSSWQMTWNVGALYEFNDRTRFGITFRPKRTHFQQGRTQILGFDVHSKSDFVLPATVTAGFYHQLTCRTAILGTLGYTLWSQFKQVTVTSNLPEELTINAVFKLDFLGVPNVSIPFNWKNTFLIAIGANQWATDKWLIKGGFAFDKSPTYRATRELRIPDQDRYHFALGARYCVSDCWTFDFGYQYIYLPTARIQNNPFILTPLDVRNFVSEQNNRLTFSSPIAINPVVNGHFKSRASVVSGQLTCKF